MLTGHPITDAIVYGGGVLIATIVVDRLFDYLLRTKDQ